MQIVDRGQQRRRGFAVGGGEQEMPHRRQCTQQQHQADVDGTWGKALQRWQGRQAKEHRPDQRSVKQHRHHGFGARQRPGQQVVASGKTGVGGSKEHTPWVQPGTGAHDQQHPQKPGNGTQPADKADLFPQQRHRQQHHKKRGQIDDGHGFTHRHHLERQTHGQRPHRQ